MPSRVLTLEVWPAECTISFHNHTGVVYNERAWLSFLRLYDDFNILSDPAGTLSKALRGEVEQILNVQAVSSCDFISIAASGLVWL